MRCFTLLLCLIFSTTISLQAQITANCDGSDPKILIAGDSWAQYMGDDDVHNAILNQYGQADKYLVTETLEPGPSVPYTGSAYAVSGSEAREWANTATYPYIANMVNALNANPSIELVILSIGGNDVLAGKSGGGWYKDMDLDVPGSEAALFATIETNTLTIINAALAVRPNIKVLLSSYEYPNFDVEFGTCWIYACDKREDLSRDPNNDLITNAELNAMMITTETQRQNMVNGLSRVYYDNSVGLMHHIYGNDNVGEGVLPKPQGISPYTPGGDPSLPSLRENFRIWGDPIHLDAEGYEYKVKNQFDNYIFNAFRGQPDATFFSEGGSLDGWVDVIGNNFGTNGIRMGDDGFFSASSDWKGILSFNTSSLPDNAVVTGASIYMHRSGEGAGSNPYSLSDFTPMIDIKNGTFGNPGIEFNDGIASANANNVGCFHGDVDEDYHVTRIDIHPSYLQHFNTTGRTQFRVYFNEADFSPNYVYYFDGSQNGFASDGSEKSSLERENIIYQEKIVPKELADGTVTEQVVVVAALAHYGLSDLMGTTAPFLDVSYEIVLPVELLNFTAKAVKKETLLEWESSMEENFLGYYIERSKDAKIWNQLKFIQSKGDVAQHQYYSMIDPFPYNGKNYYRLAMKNMDGSIDYSSIESVVFEQATTAVNAYPNPFTNEINLRFETPIQSSISVELVDVLGRNMQSWLINKFGQSELNLNIEHTIPSGAYWLKIQTQDEMIVISSHKL